MIRQSKKSLGSLVVVASIASAMTWASPALAASIPYFQDFSSGMAPVGSTLISVDNNEDLVGNAWSFTGGVIQNNVDSGAVQSKAYVPIDNAYDALINGLEIVTTAQVQIPVTSTGVNTGISAFQDVPTSGSSANYFGLHGFDALIRVNNSLAGGMKLAVYDYAGTGGGTGAAYIVGSIATGAGANIPGLTFSNDETYTLSLALRLITPAEDPVNAGRIHIAFSVTDPSGGLDPENPAPFTATVTGISAGLGSLQQAGGQQFGLYVNSSGSAYTANFDNFSVSAVPEPGSFSLAAMAVLGLPLFARKRR